MTTWGDVDGFRHFLPRIFELFATGQGLDVDPEIVISKLTYGGWTTWPAGEQQTVNRFLRAYWSVEISEYPHFRDIDAVVCSLAQAMDDLSPLLTTWSIATSCPAARQFADLVLSPQRHEEMERAFFAFASQSTEISLHLSTATTHLEWLATSRATPPT
jgi:hypothetical protein